MIKRNGKSKLNKRCQPRPVRIMALKQTFLLFVVVVVVVYLFYRKAFC